MLLYDAIDSTFDAIAKYCPITTISGLDYVMEKKHSLVSRMFWFVIGIILIVLASLLIAKSYRDWQEDPVLTSVATNQYPISQLEFPAITLCGVGNTYNNLNNAIWMHAIDYIKERRDVVNMSNAVEQNSLNTLFADNNLTFVDYLKETYPGMEDAGEEIIWQLASSNPDIEIFYFDDIITNSSELTTDPEDIELYCSRPDQVFDEAQNYCYRLAGTGTVEQAHSEDLCRFSEDLFYIIDDHQLRGFAALIVNASGPLAALNSNSSFLTSSGRNDETNQMDLANLFTTNEFILNMDITTSPMELITVDAPLNNTDERCLVLKYDNVTGKFKGNSADCNNRGKVVCMHRLGSASYINPHRLPYMLNSRTWKTWQKTLERRNKKYSKYFKNIGHRRAFESWLKVLWNTRLPCFDKGNNHSRYEHERPSGMVKQCKWKGLEVPCAAIFRAFPTNEGMCCTFNMQAAEEIFYNSSYQRGITKMQERDRTLAIGSTELPESYDNEPVPQAGINKGLSLMLDAHSDLVTTGSVSKDSIGFVAHIGSPHHYPLMSQKYILIRPGHYNLVGLSATDVKSSDDIIDVAPEKRNCYFSNEYKLELHKHYSQASCLLECQMQFAINVTSRVGEKEANRTHCIPWYLPKKDLSYMCDPREAKQFEKIMNEVPDRNCSRCLPDCVVTKYHTAVTAVPFRKCDESNFGTSPMCSPGASDPAIFGERVRQEFGEGVLPSFAVNISSNLRGIDLWGSARMFLQLENVTYDAYEVDIATVNFYFEESAVFQYKRDMRMSATDFLGLVGGFLGLCNGFSLCSAVEILFWLSYVLWAKAWKHLSNHPGKVGDASEMPSKQQHASELKRELLVLKEAIRRLELQIGEL